MKLQITREEELIFKAVRDAAHQMQQDVYAVGGFVRDRILELPCKDIDFVTTGDGPALAEAVARQWPAGETQTTVYKNFGTALVKYGEWELEFVGARKESYSPESRKPSVIPGTLHDDQLRRDFTINALAISISNGDAYTVVDPFDGLKDLRDKRIVTPLDPHQTFSDDPLRMLRAIRFSCQLQFTIDPITLEAIAEMKDRLSIVSKERISHELNKIILSAKPSRGFLLLDQTELLPLILPELSAMKGVEQYEGYGHKDNFYHTLQVLDNAASMSDHLWLRWSAILHDIAKPLTKRFEKGHGWTFHGHEVVGAGMVSGIFRRLRLPMDEKMKYVQKLVRLHLRPMVLVQEEITDAALRRLLFDAGEELDDLMLLCRADITSKNPDRVSRYLHNYEIVMAKLKDVEERDHLRNWQPPVSGEMIMETFGIPPGRVVGEIKTAIREAFLDDRLENNFENAYQFMLDEGRRHGLVPKSS
jgi:putative nucleotidyltransferase with HDIG domain